MKMSKAPTKYDNNISCNNHQSTFDTPVLRINDLIQLTLELTRASRCLSESMCHIWIVTLPRPLIFTLTPQSSSSWAMHSENCSPMAASNSSCQTTCYKAKREGGREGGREGEKIRTIIVNVVLILSYCSFIRNFECPKSSINIVQIFPAVKNLIFQKLKDKNVVCSNMNKTVLQQD